MVTIALVGGPNAGKTTLFNALTGDRQLVGNWPGVTVEKKSGVWTENLSVRILDLPGIYALTPYTPEEGVTRRVLTGQRPDAILNLVDGVNLERSLYLTVQLLELGIPMVVAVNRLDVLEKRGQALDTAQLSDRLGCPVTALSAAKGQGVDRAVKLALSQARAGTPPRPVSIFSQRVERALEDIGVLARSVLPREGRAFYLSKLFEGEEEAQKALGAGLALRQRIDLVVSVCEEDVNDDRVERIAAERYAFAGDLAHRCLTKGRGGRSMTALLDRVLLHPLLALPAFAAALLGMFWLSICLMGGWTETLMATIFRGRWSLLGRELLGVVPLLDYALSRMGCPDWLTSLAVDGVAAGVGTVLTFLPQLAALFFCLTFLEGCGYLSRGAYLLDRAVRRLGLSGKSVAPYILACGCGVPGVLACRTIRRESCRRLTVMTTTFLPCGAKLPVIALIAGTVFPGAWWVAPTAYLAGVGAILLTGWLFWGSRWFPPGDTPFLLELPDYRLPALGDLVRGTGRRVEEFLRKAGSLLVLASAAVWFAASFGWSQGAFRYLAGGNLECSLLAGVGELLEPLFAPLGWGDWRAVVAAITGLLAKESIVGTLAVLCSGGLPECLMVPAAALSFLLFNLLCAPCLAALGAIRQEMASPRHFWLTVGWQTGLAWFVALGVYQVGSLL